MCETAVTKAHLPIALGAWRSKLRNPLCSEKDGDRGDYGDAGGEHHNFRDVKSRKYRHFRHGYFPEYPDTDAKEPAKSGGIVIAEPPVNASRQALPER